MSHTSTKKSVFSRIGSTGGGSSTSTSTNAKGTHGFCNDFIKTGTCKLGETCKYIHEQPNFDKQQGIKNDIRIVKTITQDVDKGSQSVKSTIIISNEQKSLSPVNPTQVTRTVIESTPTSSSERTDRRISSSDRKQSQSHSSESKSKSSSSSHKSSKKSQSSSYERHSTSKRVRSYDSDTGASSSDSDHTRSSSHKHKKKLENHSTSSKTKKNDSIPSNHNDDGVSTDQSTCQTQINAKSPKRTIVITEKKSDENVKRIEKESKTKIDPDIEFIGTKKASRDKRSVETIHQQAESVRKTVEVKREKKSPHKSSGEHRQRHSSSTNTQNNILSEKTIQIKIESNTQPLTKLQNSLEQSDQNGSQSNLPVLLQLSASPGGISTLEMSERTGDVMNNETEKLARPQSSSPVYVILDEERSRAPSVETKTVRETPTTTPTKKTHEREKSSSKQSKRSRDSDKTRNTKEKSSDNHDTKRKRLNDGSTKKVSSSSKNEKDSRTTSSRSDSRHNTKTSSKDESSSRKYDEKSELKSSRRNKSKDRTSSIPSSKSRNNSDRRETTRTSPETKRSSHRRDRNKEVGTDSEEHLDEMIVPKQSAIEAYMAMDWSSLSLDKRIPLNGHVTSRIARNDSNNTFPIGASERLLTDEQKRKLNGMEFQSLPLTYFMKQLQLNSSSQIINSCSRRFGSCAKDMIDMRHKWFIKSAGTSEQYEFINKDHYISFQQAINCLSEKTPNEMPAVQIETTTADVLLS